MEISEKMAGLAQLMAMERLGSAKISGELLRKLRHDLIMTQGELGQAIGLSEVRVRHIESLKVTGIRPKVLRALAHLTGKTPQEIAGQLAPVEEELDRNIEPYDEVAVPDIPTFDLPLAAGAWMELADVEQLRDQKMINDGRFRVHLRGDSMEKVYPNGSLVEFRCLKPDLGDGRGSRLEIGADYYVQRAESATFKRLEFFDNEMLVFTALNKKRYPAKIKVLRSDVVRMAKMEWILSKPKG